ncbi:MAG: DUF3783 domain-containing protein [Deltaproteobacteria bacterium]|nr:DUF3783 domain-containing protein [Deltaproteobacteria bacterium]
MNDSSFQKVEKSEKRMFGPPCILICGYKGDEQEMILSLIKRCGLSRHPVVFATEDDANLILRDIVTVESGKGRGRSSGLERAIIMSGLTENELHSLLSTYRKEKYTPQLWATLTPISEGWPLRELLKELSAEAEAFRKRQQKKNSGISSDNNDQT